MSELILAESKQAQVAQSAQPMRLIELAITQGADVDKLERLMALQTQWEAKEARKAFLEAMANFQSKCPDIMKLKKGHNYLYAPLSDIVAQIRDILSASGLSYRFEQSHENGIQVTCIVSHIGGHSEQTTMKAAPDASGSKNAIQAVGSAVQYLMRYTLIGALGITTADHDMDGRLPQKQEANPISLESEAYLTDYYNAMPEENQPKFMAWLRVESIAQLTEESAQKAIAALKAKK